MKPLFSAPAQIRRARSAWTLVEMMVAIGAGLMILGAFVAITLNVNTMMKMAGNYGDLDEYSRNTLDMLSRDIRNAYLVSTTSTDTNLVLVNTYAGITNNIIYSWDGSNVMTRTYGTNAPEMVLTNCGYLNFDFFTRVPQNGLQFIDITNAISQDEVKLVSVSWRCSRSILGAKLNTESVQTAQIMKRN